MEAAAGHGVDAELNAAQVGGGVGAEVRALADVAADEAVAVLVGGSLPGRVRLGEVDVDAAQLGEVGVACHLATLIPGEGAAQPLGDPVEDLDESGEGGIVAEFPDGRIAPGS